MPCRADPVRDSRKDTASALLGHVRSPLRAAERRRRDRRGRAGHHAHRTGIVDQPRGQRQWRGPRGADGERGVVRSRWRRSGRGRPRPRRPGPMRQDPVRDPRVGDGRDEAQPATAAGADQPAVALERRQLLGVDRIAGVVRNHRTSPVRPSRFRTRAILPPDPAASSRAGPLALMPAPSGRMSSGRSTRYTRARRASLQAHPRPGGETPPWTTATTST